MPAVDALPALRREHAMTRRIVIELHGTTTATHCGRCIYRVHDCCDVYGRLLSERGGPYERHEKCIQAEVKAGEEPRR